MSQHSQQIVLPENILHQFLSLTQDQIQATLWVGRLYVHRLLWPKGFLRKPLLTPDEERNAQAILIEYTEILPNMAVEAAASFALMEACNAGIADWDKCFVHLQQFFKDTKQGKV